MKNLICFMIVLFMCVNMHAQNKYHEEVSDWSSLASSRGTYKDTLSEMYNKLFSIGESTSEAEYNYITKGIMSSLAGSLDIKKGYLIDGQANFNSLKRKEYEINEHAVWFFTLSRSIDNSIAGMIVRVRHKSGGKVFMNYFCIPVNNEVLEKKFISSINEFGANYVNAVLMALVRDCMYGYGFLNSFESKAKADGGDGVLKGFKFNDSDRAGFKRQLQQR